MKPLELGNLKVYDFQDESIENTTICDFPYFFRLIHLSEGMTFIENIENSSIIVGNNNPIEMYINEEKIQTKNLKIQSANIKVVAKKKTFLITCETYPEISNGNNFEYYNESEIKKVNKPWGHELWFEHDKCKFALKRIFIKAGNQISLQYHERKRESMLITSGDLTLFYKNNPGIANQDITNKEISTTAFSSLVGIHIEPLAIHRIKADTDITIYEISTLDLDDVIRIQDDTNRNSGKILSEHA